MTNEEAIALFERAGALLTGHFKLSSGLHSDRYLEKFRIVENPEICERFCAELADKFANDDVRIVLGPTTAGIILAYNVGRWLGVEARFAEKVDGVRGLRRGQILEPGTRVLVVDDILTTGGAVRECIDVVRQHGAVLVGIGLLADRSGGVVDMGAKMEAVLALKVDTWPQESCPMCARRMPIYQPGTSGLK